MKLNENYDIHELYEYLDDIDDEYIYPEEDEMDEFEKLKYKYDTVERFPKWLLTHDVMYDLYELMTGDFDDVSLFDIKLNKPVEFSYVEDGVRYKGTCDPRTLINDLFTKFQDADSYKEFLVSAATHYSSLIYDTAVPSHSISEELKRNFRIHFYHVKEAKVPGYNHFRDDYWQDIQANNSTEAEQIFRNDYDESQWKISGIEDITLMS